MIKRIFRCLSILFFTFLLLFLYFFLHKKFHFYIPCVFHSVTGLYCPGCGITRCLFALLSLDIQSAFHYNMLVCIFLPFFLASICYSCFVFITGKENLFFVKIPKWVWYVLLIITILFGIFRNIPMFSFLAPTSL